MLLRGRTIALAVTGSIAAYKAVEVARLLMKAGARVIPVMTASAARFIGPVTLTGVCGEAVASDMWDPGFSGEMHVAIASQVDAIAIVPATADILARLAGDAPTILVVRARPLRARRPRARGPRDASAHVGAPGDAAERSRAGAAGTRPG